VPLRIAFDMDGVLADMESALIRQAEGLFGEGTIAQMLETPSAPAAEDGPTAETPAAGEDAPPVARLNMTHRQQRRLWRHIGTVENFWQSLEEIEPGAIGKLAAMAIDRRWEVIFLTKRPASAGVTAQIQTQRWLEAKGFTLPSVYVVQGNRGRIAAALDLDFVIDDRPENCLDVAVDSKARAILVWREPEKQFPSAAKKLGIGVVKSVEECLAILSQVGAPKDPETPGMMERVMRLLGLKEAAKA
jgi:hypothetical protein